MGSLHTERRGRKISAPLIKQKGNIAAGFQTFCHFQVDVCLQQIPVSSRLGRSVGMSPVFMLKGPCEAISIHDHDGGRRAEGPAFLICNTCRLSLLTNFTTDFVPQLHLKLVSREITAAAVGGICGS